MAETLYPKPEIFFIHFSNRLSWTRVKLYTNEKNLQTLREQLGEYESKIDYWDAAVRAADLAIGYLSEMKRCDDSTKNLKIRKALITEKIDDYSEKQSQAESLLKEIEKTGWITRKWRRLPPAEQQSAIVENLKNKVKKIASDLDEVNYKQTKTESRLSRLSDLLESFTHEYRDEPKKIIVLADKHKKETESLRDDINEKLAAYATKHAELQKLLKERLFVLSELGMPYQYTDNLDTMLDAIKEAFDHARSMIKDVNMTQLQIEIKQLNSAIEVTKSELAETIEMLKRVGELIIQDASIVATTLTKAYLSDAIQNRSFDTVILDEASMAPIPALWTAASIARNNAIVVGDPEQLPPIVISKHHLAKKWLGRDIFDVAGLTGSLRHPYLINLKRQYRMHPEISSIPNKLIYKGSLEDDPCTLNSGELERWYHSDWGHDAPVLLVDTSSIGAWVTSVARGQGASRLNFLSATICMDIIEQVLNEDRVKLQNGQSPRILAACPYRPHAQLLKLLIQEQGLEHEVQAGTAHSFQGTEADLVVFDFVNDAPHWKVAMFMSSMDENMRKLLNVALTRAKRRLIIVGNFEYIGKHAKKAFVGVNLLPFLLHKFPMVNSLDIVRGGLAAKAAKAQATVFGGDVEATSNRIVVTQEYFFRYLRSDFANSRFQIVVYSPFITENRLSQLEPQMRAAIERGVNIYIVTKPYCDRKKREIAQYRMLEDMLNKWGIIVIHKQRMHEKLIFIDNNILWEGSLNPLSFRDTEEHMERRLSKKVFSDYANTLHLNDLIGEYVDGFPHCPICGEEVVACEGRDEPFYWRCIEKDCYTRSINQPALRGGIIRCNRCGDRVEYGEWGGKPAWRCLQNRRHHQRIARTHLRLPKMRAIIPKKHLEKMDALFNTKTVSLRSKTDLKNKQFNLFE